MRRTGVLAVVATILFLAAPQAVVTASGPVSVAPPSQQHVVKSSGVSSVETAVACSGPAQISPVEAATVPSETVTLSWNDVSGCTFAGYTLRVRTDADFDGDPSLNLVDMAVAATSQQVTIPSGHRNQALYWAVKAANAADGAAWSSRTFQIVPPTVPSSAPTAPTDIAATTLSRASIRVTWSDNSNNEDGFRIYRWSVLDGPDWVVAGTTAADTTTFSDTGLQPSTHYHYFTCGFNAGGQACASLQLDATTLSALPAAPTNVSATTVASTSIRFTWADNSDNEDGFRVYRWSLPDGGKQWVLATTTAPGVTTFLDTGLQLSADYFYFACSYNFAGEACPTGVPGWLGATTTDGLPTAPRAVSGSPANTAAQVSWSAPTSDGGSAITTYVATSSPGGRTCATSGLTTCGITGLTNGTAYTFTVVARNARGEGPASTQSSAITPRTVPGAPTAVIGTPANNSVAVSWSAPALNGGSPVMSYTARVSPGGSTCTTSVLTCTIGGLINGAPYTFTVTATNVAGPGVASAASAAVTPRTVPTAPLTVTATRGTGQAHVSWAAPISNGGNAIIGYTVTSSPGGKTCTSAGLSCWVTGLTNGTPYTFTVRATNNAGTGIPSTASTAVTPSAVVVRPTATITPLALYRSTTTVTVTWGAIPGSAPVTNFDVRYRVAPWNGTFGTWITGLAATTTTVGTLAATAGNTYCFIVIAHASDGGTSAATAETCTVVPLDDRSLARAGTWSLGTGTAYYNHTFARSATSGAKLTRTGVVAKRIAIVATTCSTCGSVRVYWGTTLLKTISLHSTTTANRKIIAVTTFSSVRTGTLSLRVYGSGHNVVIDGVAITRS
jgi:hypothetical protein